MDSGGKRKRDRERIFKWRVVARRKRERQRVYSNGEWWQERDIIKMESGGKREIGRLVARKGEIEIIQIESGDERDNGRSFKCSCSSAFNDSFFFGLKVGKNTLK